MAKVDLHTHSYGSPDGGLRLRHFQRMLDTGQLDVIAVTDHNSITVAKALQEHLGKRIIIGEEIATTEGEIIGLYLKKSIPAGHTPEETIKRIRAQNGLVYVPHPFESIRKGLSEKTLKRIAAEIDILEVHNGRAVFQNFSNRTASWGKKHQIVGAASSDTYGWRGWGKTYTEIGARPTRATLVQLLEEATYAVQAPGVLGLLYPKFNRARTKLRLNNGAD